MQAQLNAQRRTGGGQYGETGEQNSCYTVRHDSLAVFILQMYASFRTIFLIKKKKFFIYFPVIGIIV